MDNKIMNSIFARLFELERATGFTETKSMQPGYRVFKEGLDNVPKSIKEDMVKSALADKIARCIILSTDTKHLLILIEQLYLVAKQQEETITQLTRIKP